MVRLSRRIIHASRLGHTNYKPRRRISLVILPPLAIEAFGQREIMKSQQMMKSQELRNESRNESCTRKRDARRWHLGLLLLMGCLSCDPSTAFVAVGVRRTQGVSVPSERISDLVQNEQRQEQLTRNRIAYHHLRAIHDENDNCSDDQLDSNNRRRGRLARWKRRGKRWATTMALAGTIMFGRGGGNVAHAKFSHELSEGRVYSLRPGVNTDQAKSMMDGEMPEDAPEAKSLLDKQGSASPSTSGADASSTPKKKKDAKKKKASTFDYGDEDDDEENDVLFLEDEESEYGQAVVAAGASPLKQSENEASNALKSRTKSEFSGIDTSKSKTKMLYVKVSVGFFVPTYGSLVVREWYRRRKEEAYVQKGLEVLEAQKKEYFGSDEDEDDEDGDGDDEGNDEDGDEEEVSF